MGLGIVETSRCRESRFRESRCTTREEGVCWDLRDIEIQSERECTTREEGVCGILERRDPELRGHESIEDAQQKPVNESAEFESEREWVGIV